MRELLRSNVAGRIASLAIGGYIRLVGATSRFSYIGREHGEALDAGDRGFIVAFWHARLLLAPLVLRETARPVFMLGSAHRDAEIIARAAQGFGVRFIRGSAADPAKPEKHKGGASAIGQMLAALKAGAVVGLTPDGPRGPRETVKIGAVRLAQLSGAPILPSAYATSTGWRLGSWDRFFLPAPFSQGAFVARAPIFVPREAGPAELEAARLRLQDALNEAVALAERAAPSRRRSVPS